ncbi:hypothetical protein BGZ97_013126, partial [Linnemannia gamsii]
IEEEYIAMSKYARYHEVVNESGESMLSLDYVVGQAYSGYTGFIVARPLLYDLLLKQIPAHKIHFGTRVQSIKDEGDKVEIQSTVGEIYRGDILVGADGAYSTVRQSLYARLDNEGRLPKEDLADLPFRSTCLVGQTEPLNLEQYPQLKDPKCPFFSTLSSDKPYSWALFPTAQNTIAWMVLFHHPYSSKTAEEKRASDGENAEWGPNAAHAMIEKTRDFPISFGDGKRTLGDLYDQTPIELISKVMLEEKIFETWSSGRVVLLGDACHKLNPAGGQGAITAMHDAIALANLLYALPTDTAPTTSEIEQAFSEYRAERYPAAVEAFNGSQMLAKFMEKGIGGKIAFFLAKHIPTFLWNIFVKDMVSHRPQLGCLDAVPERGSVPAAVEKSSVKARETFERRRQAASAVM